MDETYRMLGREREADLEREAARARLATKAGHDFAPRRTARIAAPARWAIAVVLARHEARRLRRSAPSL